MGHQRGPPHDTHPRLEEPALHLLHEVPGPAQDGAGTGQAYPDRLGMQDLHKEG